MFASGVHKGLVPFVCCPTIRMDRVVAKASRRDLANIHRYSIDLCLLISIGVRVGRVF